MFSKSPKDRPLPDSEPETEPGLARVPATRQPEPSTGRRHTAPVEVANKVASILEAAQTASEQIRADATQEAAAIRREAESQVARLRAEAEGYAAQTRQAADLYASQHRREAQDHAQSLLQEAQGQLETAREASEDSVRKAEREIRRRQEQVRTRQDQLRTEARELEERLEGTLEGLQEVVAHVEDILGRQASESDSGPEAPTETKPGLLWAVDPANRRAQAHSEGAAPRTGTQ